MKLRSLLFVLVALLLSRSGFGQGVVPTMGKEFWLGFMENYSGSQELKIYVSSRVNTTGSVVMPLGGFSQNFNVTANVVTTLSIPTSAMSSGSETVDTKSILVRTADTVAVFALNWTPATADAAVIYPIQSLGIEYRVQAYQGLSAETDKTSELMVVATRQQTQVEITPTCSTQGGHAAGVPFIVDLDSGQTYQVKAQGWQCDLTGSTVIGTGQSGTCRPFAVFSGSQCPFLPDGCFACDHVFDENLPRNAWGSSYYVVPWQGSTRYTLQLLADQNGTVVQVDGGAPINMNAGQEIELNAQTGAKCITGNKPFSVAQYMEGSDCAGESDPAELILNAEEQKIADITFAAVVSPNISVQYANVIVETAATGNVLLDGAPVPSASFTTFPFCGNESYAQLPLTQGSHRLTCAQGLTAYIYGKGPNYETYAYSVGSFTPVPLVPIDSVFCGLDSNGTLTLGPPVPINNPWWSVYSNPDDTIYVGTPYTFVPPGSDIYIVTGGEFLSGCSQSYYFSVEVAEPPALTMSASSTNICAYSEVQLGVTPNPTGTYLYNWWPDAELDDGSLPNPVAHPSHSGWFYVSVSTLNHCAVALDSIYINVIGGDVLVYNAGASDDAICVGDTTQLGLDVQQIIRQDQFDAPPNAMWQDIQNGTISNACGSVNGTALYFDGPNPRQATTVPLDVSAGGTVQFAIKLGSGLAPCDDVEPGEDVVLEYSTGGPWTTMATLWEYLYTTFTTVSLPIPPAAQSTTTQFRWRQLNSTGPGEDNWSLDNVAIAVHDVGGLSMSWTPLGSLSAPSQDSTLAWPPATTTYYINTTDNQTGCTYVDSVHISVGLPFTLNVSDDTTMCDVAGLQLHAIPSAGTGHTWTWTPGATLSSAFVENPTATPSSTTEYHVTVSSAEGCTREDSVTVTVGQLLDLQVFVDDDMICQGQSVALSAFIFGNNLSYAWTPSASVSNPSSPNTNASPTSSTWYVCTVTDNQSGCVLNDSVHVTVSTVYNVFAGNDTIVCTTTGLQLHVQHNVVNPIIQWSPANHLTGATTANPTVIFDSTSTYIVQVSDILGCSDRDTIVVTVAFDQLTLFSDTSLCQGDSALLDPGYPTATHQWSTGETTQWIWVDSPGDYTVDMTDVNGCQTSHTTTVTVDPLPVIALGPDTSLCIGEQYTLDAGNPGSSYLWNTGQTTQTITVADPGGTYRVRVIDGNQCLDRDTVVVTFDSLPVVSLHDTTVCVSQTVVLDAGNPGSSYLWNTGATTQTISVNAASGHYSVVVTTPTWCRDSSEADLQFVDFPVVDIGPDRVLCDGDTLLLDAGNPGMSYFWYNAATTQTITVLDDAEPWVNVFNGYCNTRDSMVAVFNPLPAPLSEDTRVLCLNYPPYKTIIDAGNPGCTYLWNTDATTQAIDVDTYGTYIVQITTPLNCSITDSITLVEYCGSECFIPNSFTPDGDGINDTFGALGTNIAHMQLTIFDRWGEAIWTGADGHAYWDGKVNGTTVQDGVYAYKLTYSFFDDPFGELGSEKEAIGHVTLLK